MIILGLTGSIGMGKSATAAMFAEAGVPVHDADATVHDLYDGEAVPAIEAAFPGSTANGQVDRVKLSAQVVGHPAALKKLEAIVHPMVVEKREFFLDAAKADGAAVALLDIPLLYETGADAMCDAVVVVSAPAHVQRERVLERPGMTAERFESLLLRQIPDDEKRRRADFVVDTSQGFDKARAQVADILRTVVTMYPSRP
ncbi:MAG TPA: dephospho-CoA kinase [Pseudolabrys sp.]|nr:dephospho-CoA kinase [Pseudolabrys sp.]